MGGGTPEKGRLGLHPTTQTGKIARTHASVPLLAYRDPRRSTSTKSENWEAPFESGKLSRGTPHDQPGKGWSWGFIFA